MISPVRPDAEPFVRAAPELSVRPELVEGHMNDAERLAAGFAEHVVRWAKRVRNEGTALAVRPELVEGQSSKEEDGNLEILRRCAHATSLATSNGHVCVLLSELAESSSSASGGGQPLSPSPPGGGLGWGQLPDPATLRTTLLQSGIVGTPDNPASLPLILDDDGRLYLHRYFDYEVRLARRLMQAANTPPREVTPAARNLLSSLFPPANDNEVDWQKIAAAMALRGSLTVISGGPGTGKTTTVVNLLACLLTQEPHTRVALAAPTGKAAARMTEAIRQRADHLPADLRAKLPQESFTIHRLLGVNPSRSEFTYHAGNPLPYDALIVDEASMLDLALATRLLEAVPASARIILLGDKDQLAAVEAGAVFAELSADPTLTDVCRRGLAALCGYPPERIEPPAPAQASPLHDAAVWLTKNYRFAADSAIGKLARFINQGRAEEALALLRASRSEQQQTLDSPSPPFAPNHSEGSPPFALSLSKGERAQRPASPKHSKRRVGDTASLCLFPELEPMPASKGVRPPVQERDTSIQWLDPEQADNVLDAVVVGYANYFEAVRRNPTDVAEIFRAFNQFRVLCAVREGPTGVTTLNEQVTRYARRVLASVSFEEQSHSRWYVGRPVMVLRNDYVLKAFNGDIGIALPDGRGGLAVAFPEGEAGYRFIPLARMPEHETGYALTVHKAQGAEFQRVLTVLPATPRALSRELLYTAVTRARSGATLFATAGALEVAITCQSQSGSGLADRLAGFAE